MNIRKNKTSKPITPPTVKGTVTYWCNPTDTWKENSQYTPPLPTEPESS